MTARLAETRLAMRLARANELDKAWQNASLTYGKQITKELKALLPADPDFLFDVAVFSWQGEGLTKKQARQKVLDYTQDDWNEDWTHFKGTIERGLAEIQDKWKDPPKMRQSADNNNYRHFPKYERKVDK